MATTSGYLLFEALWQAAERGVRVRLLLDDLQHHRARSHHRRARRASEHRGAPLQPGRQSRNLRALNLPDRLLARQPPHAQQVVHRRQPGDDRRRTQHRRRVLRRRSGRRVRRPRRARRRAGGARGVAAAFDLYWNSASAYPAWDCVGRRPGQGAAATLEAKFAAIRADPARSPTSRRCAQTPLVRELLDGKLALEWATAQLVYDDPAKTLDTDGRGRRPAAPGAPAHDRPAANGRSTSSRPTSCRRRRHRALAALAKRGVHGAHPHQFARGDRRAAGACGLREAPPRPAPRRRAALRAQADARRRDQPEIRQRASAAARRRACTPRRSRSTARAIFVGSFNFDPRSAHLNTEMGLVLESPALAERLARDFDDEVPNLAYEVRLAADGDSWNGSSAPHRARSATPPSRRRDCFRRAMVRVLSILPIEWLL